MGTVSAMLLPVDMRWFNHRGSEMHGHAGEWLVTDGDSIWTIYDDAFRRTYRPCGGGHYIRVGEILATPLEEDVIVPTPEGPGQAAAGDWLCWDPYVGDCWPVDATKFHALPADQAPKRATVDEDFWT